MVKQKIDILIFDLDGTLIDSRKDLANAVNFARNQYDLKDIDMMSVARHIGHGARNLIHKTIPGLESEELDNALSIFKKYYQDHCVEQTIVYKGVPDMLEYFKSKAMAVVSNKPYPFTIKILEELNLSQYFRIILGEESHPKKKPDPAPLLHVIEQLKGNPSKSCMVGDWITDIEAGKSAGMITVGCLYGIGEPVEIYKLKPNYTVDSILQLKDIFE